MRALAIDVVLLPPDSVQDIIINFNNRFEPSIKLSKEDFLPHITLAQAAIWEEDLPKATSRLERIANNFQSIEIKAYLVDKPQTMLAVTKNEMLDELHRRVMTDFSGLFNYDVKEEHHYEQPIRDKSLAYIRNFSSNYAHDKYYPHITLWTQKAVNEDLRLSFFAKRLAICHLGNFNTCRNVFFETNLRKKQ